jgi:S-formylglutathione hydrolase FrmB
LHGWSGTCHQWNDIIDCQEYADDYGFVIICPDGLYDLWYINSPVPEENQFESFFVSDLLPFISGNFRIQQQNIFITGLSMGGHGALYLFAKHPGFFKSAGSLSGLLQLNDWRHHFGIDRVLGLEGKGNDNNLLSLYSVAGNIDRIQSARKKIIVSCGTEDPFYTINTHFVAECKRHDIDVRFVKSAGGHTATYWASAIGQHFDFFRKLTTIVDD